ncbi:hypothetical protein PROFUN_09604, partial [Planoprotostelium fungivorum]
VWKRIMMRGTDTTDTLNLFMAVPTIYAKLSHEAETVDAEERRKFREASQKFRLMVSGSAALPESVMKKWAELSGHRLLERYGMSEIGMALSNPLHGERIAGAVGQPLPGVEVRLWDEAANREAKSGEPGEVRIKGDTVFIKYWDRPDATAETFDSEGWFKTGDIGSYSEKEKTYRLLGRASVDIIKSGGYKISALDVERELLEHPHIREIAVVGIPNEEYGQVMGAIVVLAEGEEMTVEDLKHWAKDKMASYKVPRQLLVLDEMPRNAMGKTNKKELVNTRYDNAKSPTILVFLTRFIKRIRSPKEHTNSSRCNHNLKEAKRRTSSYLAVRLNPHTSTHTRIEIMSIHNEERDIKMAKDNKLKLLNYVCAALIHEPDFYTSADQIQQRINEACQAVVTSDPEFILKTAFYVRDQLNVRSTANYLLAWASIRKECQPFVKHYFAATVRLPSDLLDVMSMVTVWLNNTSIPTCLRKAAAKKFAEYDEFSLAKYNKEKAQKSKKKRAAKKQKVHDAEPAAAADEERKGVHITATNKMTLKQLIRRLHISEPSQTVMRILGKKYPANEEEFQKSGLPGSFDSTKAGSRMKLPTPETWETQVSAKGNRNTTWEELMDHDKLPFMAMLRNIRNFIISGVSPDHHEKVIARLTDERSVTNSKQLPWRFLSAYDAIKIDLEGLMNDILDHDGSEFKIVTVKVKGKKGEALGGVRQIKKRVIIPYHMPDLPLIERYRHSIDTAVKLSTQNNLPPIAGRTVVFVDVSGSMDTPVTRNKVPSLQKAMDVAALIGLMIHHSAEDCHLRIFSSPSGNGRPDLPVDDLSGDSILDNVNKILEKKRLLGGGTDFPFQYIRDAIDRKEKIDTLVVLSDMMIAPNRNGPLSIGGIMREYRQKVNPGLLFVSVDLRGAGTAVNEIDLEDEGNVLVTGFSDNILRLIAERGNEGQLATVEGMRRKVDEIQDRKEKKAKK